MSDTGCGGWTKKRELKGDVSRKIPIQVGVCACIAEKMPFPLTLPDQFARELELSSVKGSPENFYSNSFGKLWREPESSNKQ